MPESRIDLPGLILQVCAQAGTSNPFLSFLLQQTRSGSELVFKDRSLLPCVGGARCVLLLEVSETSL